MKRHLTGEFEKKYERKTFSMIFVLALNFGFFCKVVPKDSLVVQLLLVWKFIHWISSPTAGKSDFIAGTQLVRRNLVASGMDTSE